MMVSLLLWATLLAFVASPINAGGSSLPSLPPDPFTRFPGPPTCLQNIIARTMTTTFPVQLNQDEINVVKACRENTTTGELFYENCSAEFFAVNGERYLTVNSTVNLDDPSDALADNPCGFTAIPIAANKWKYVYRIILKRYDHLLMLGDMGYKWECNPDTAINGVVTANMQVNFSIIRDIEVKNPVVDFMIVREGDTQEITECTVGENLEILASMTQVEDYEDIKHFYGMFFYDMFAARTEVDLYSLTRVTPLTDVNGCGDGNKLERNLIYDPSASSLNTAMYRSGILKCERYYDTDQLVIGTTLSFCRGERTSSLADTSDKCYDFCSYNAGVRKRRDVTDEIPTDTIQVKLTIKDAEETTEKTESLSQTTLIVVAVALSVLVLALLATFGCFLCWMKRSRESKGDGSWDSSRASSDRKLPMRF